MAVRLVKNALALSMLALFVPNKSYSEISIDELQCEVQLRVLGGYSEAQLISCRANRSPVIVRAVSVNLRQCGIDAWGARLPVRLRPGREVVFIVRDLASRCDIFEWTVYVGQHRLTWRRL